MDNITPEQSTLSLEDLGFDSPSPKIAGRNKNPYGYVQTELNRVSLSFTQMEQLGINADTNLVVLKNSAKKLLYLVKLNKAASEGKYKDSLSQPKPNGALHESIGRVVGDNCPIRDLFVRFTLKEGVNVLEGTAYEIVFEKCSKEELEMKTRLSRETAKRFANKPAIRGNNPNVGTTKPAVSAVSKPTTK